MHKWYKTLGHRILEEEMGEGFAFFFHSLFNFPAEVEFRETKLLWFLLFRHGLSKFIPTKLTSHNTYIRYSTQDLTLDQMT